MKIIGTVGGSEAVCQQNILVRISGARPKASAVNWANPRSSSTPTPNPLVTRPMMVLFLGIAFFAFLLFISQSLLETFQTAEDHPNVSATIADKWRETDDHGVTVYKLEIAVESWPHPPKPALPCLS